MNVIAFVFFAFWSFSLNAETPDALEELKGALDKIQTLNGHFEQTIKDNKGQPVQEASLGRFTLKRPGYFLWESEEPFNQLVVGTPDTLKIYDPDLEQLSIYPRGTNDQNNPAHLLSGDLSALKSTFMVQRQENKKSGLIFELSPIHADTSYQKIIFSFQNGQIERLSFLDKLNQTTEILFNKLTVNEAVSATEFEFIAPEGTDIIHNE